MAPPQSALRQVEPAHIHPLSEKCPTCDQPIDNDKAKEIRAKAEDMQRRMDEAAEARAAAKLAERTTQIEADAKAKIEKAEQEKAEAVRTANAETTAKVEAAKAEGHQSGEAAAAQKVAAAEKAKTDVETAAAQKVAAAEKAKVDADTAAAVKIAAAEAAAKTDREQAQQQLAAANAEKDQALAKAKQIEADRDAAVQARDREVRDAMEKDTAAKLAEKDAESGEKTRKLQELVKNLERKLEEKTAGELGEGAHIDLLNALKQEFPGDDIQRIRPGVSGADILHKVMRNGIECGSILWESKNSTGWRDDYVTKLIRDQTAARADHAVLSTFKFPSATAQVAHRDGVVIVNPARAVAIAHMIRKHLLLVQTLRLSKTERLEKMAALYDFMTSERCALLLNRIDSDAEALLELQASEKTFHDNHWKKQGLRYKSIQKAKADLDVEVGAIIGGVDSVG
jgi:hypothetical protein